MNARAEPQKGKSAKTTLLAGLISSARRSAAQSERYTLQRARPLANARQIDYVLTGRSNDGDAQRKPPERRRTGETVNDASLDNVKVRPISEGTPKVLNPEPNSWNRPQQILGHRLPCPASPSMSGSTAKSVRFAQRRDTIDIQSSRSMGSLKRPSSHDIRSPIPKKRKIQSSTSNRNMVPMSKRDSISPSNRILGPIPKRDSRSPRGEKGVSTPIGRRDDGILPLEIRHESPDRTKNKKSKSSIFSLHAERKSRQNPHSSIQKEVQIGTAKIQDTTTQPTAKPAPSIDISRIHADASTDHERVLGELDVVPAANHAPQNVASKQIVSAPFAAKRKSRKRRGFSPFRIKLGYVVAVRFRRLSDGGNNCVLPLVEVEDSSFQLHQSHTCSSEPKFTKSYEVWSQPIPGRDDGLAMLGSWIKVAFPKTFLKLWQGVGDGKVSAKSLEGNIVSFLSNEPLTVGLLVDRSVTSTHPFLRVISDDSDNTGNSPSEMKKLRIEAQIRGESKVVVSIILKSPAVTSGAVESTVEQCPWVVRKRVLVSKASDKNPSKRKVPLFVGDGNDTHAQQEKNWRWVANHSTFEGPIRRDVTSVLVGEVVKMDVTPNATANEVTAAGTLAKVTIRQLWTPEQSQCGRSRGLHGLHLFTKSGQCANYFQAPIEDLIAIGKKSGNGSDEQAWRFNITDGESNTLVEDRCIASPSKTDRARDVQVSSFSRLSSSLLSVQRVNFELPLTVGQLSKGPSLVPSTGEAGRKSNDVSKGKKKKTSSPVVSVKVKKQRQMSKKEEDDGNIELEEAGCSRAVDFNLLRKKKWGLSKLSLTYTQPQIRESSLPRALEKAKKPEDVVAPKNGRAARANQRRMLKSLATLGSASSCVDRLAGRDREQELRFDKSFIHGWGVVSLALLRSNCPVYSHATWPVTTQFAEEHINAGDLIIEYRGELIRNAVADKREKEYEAARMDDYMFRIDANTVCDATIRGNVARYINASCDPNCYTQIITAGDNKRIVIYAKRDIPKGGELVYDYKFSLETDPEKRLICNCGAKMCKGFMNWVRLACLFSCDSSETALLIMIPLHSHRTEDFHDFSQKVQK